MRLGISQTRSNHSHAYQKVFTMPLEDYNQVNAKEFSEKIKELSERINESFQIMHVQIKALVTILSTEQQEKWYECFVKFCNELGIDPVTGKKKKSPQEIIEQFKNKTEEKNG